MAPPSSSTPFMFGAGAGHEFPVDVLHKTKFELAQTTNALAEALAANSRLERALALASDAANNARRAEQIAKKVLSQIRNDYHLLRAETMADDSGDYDRIVELQNRLETTDATIRGLREELSQKQKDYQEATTASLEATKKAEKLATEIDALRTTNNALRSDLEHEKAAALDRESFLNKAYADRKDAEDARIAALDARDALERDLVGLQFDRKALEEELQHVYGQKAQLEEELHHISRLQEENHNLEADVERLQSHIDDHERTLIVKDERIAHLEGQYQKERQRNLTADAALAAATATPGSPMEEDPPALLSTVGETLSSELGGLYDEDYEDVIMDDVYLDFSNVVPVYAFAPVAPTQPPNSIIPRVSELSIAPVTAPIPRLSLSFNDAGAIAVSPVAPSQPKLDIAHSEAGNIAPIAPAQPKLSPHVNEAVTVEPVAPVLPKLSQHLQEHVTVEPIEPVAPAQPKLSQHLNESAVVEPIAPSQQQLSVAVNKIDQLHVEPIAPTQQQLSVAVSKIDHLHFEPVAPLQPTLRITTTSVTLDIPPLEPVEVSTVSTQTETLPAPENPTTVQPEAQILTTHILDNATVTVAPIAMQELAPILTPQDVEIGDITFTLDLEPQDSQLIAAETANGTTQTTFTGPIVDRPVPVVSRPNKVSTLQAFSPFLVVLLIILCAILWNELDSWRTANGVSIGHGYGNAYTTRGAYGNGRNLLGHFPLAQDIGHSWLSEQVAKYSSVAIARFEEWAGISNQILY